MIEGLNVEGVTGRGDIFVGPGAGLVFVPGCGWGLGDDGLVFILG